MVTLTGEETRGEEIVRNKYPGIICSAQPHHSGNYTCKPSSSTPASIQLFVLGENFFYFVNFLLTIISENIYCLVGRLNDMETWF